MGGNPSFMRGHDAVGVLTAAAASQIVAAHNATYAAGINPEAVKDLLSFAVSMAKNEPSQYVGNEARRLVAKAKEIEK